MATQSVHIPVELELKTLQSSIGTLEKALSSVKPGTKIYNYLSQQLERVKRDFLGLQVAAEKSYTKIGQVKGFEKNFNKVTDEIQILARSFDSLQFDDLNFGKNDLKEITSLQGAIAKIKKEISSVNTDAFKNLFLNSAELQETFKDLHLNINTEDAEQAIKKVTQALDKIDLEEKRINRSTNSKMGEITELDKRIDDLKNFKNIITNLDDVEYFKKDKSFKNKNKFIQDWSGRLGIDEESLRALTSNGAKKMIDAYEEMEKEVQRKLDAASKDRTKKQKTVNDNQSKLSELSEKKELYSAALVKMQDIGIDPAVIAELDRLQKALQTAQRELAEMKAELIALKGPGNQTEQVIKDTGEAARKAVPSINSSIEATENLNAQNAKLNSMQNAIKQWFGFNEVINLTKRTVRDAIDHIRELDKAMTEIAVVTDMDQDDLWGQIGTYSKIAQEYGVSTVGVYEVSQLYYQQGLATAEVMQLTEETLKMAKIANIDYAEATDYMTVAIRGFKMEMSGAQNVVDVYSNIAAITASDTEELAVAMSKTASSAEAVGASFENTTAMIALMVETTREAPQNIGSALKSIISRYGEMTSDPMKLVDSEGEEMSLNKVDKALKSIEISLQDATGQFRAFDEVILELSSKWGTLDVNTQRYIATVMAGNRQQSRFLALVGNYDRLSELYDEAANSEGAAALQAAKTMDSVETKINQMKVAFQEFYTSTGVQNLIKGVIDFITQLINRFNDFSKMWDKFPARALAIVGGLITSIKSSSSILLEVLVGKTNQLKNVIIQAMREAGVQGGKEIENGISKGMTNAGKKNSKASAIASGISIVGSGAQMYGLSAKDEKTAGWLTGIGGTVSKVGSGVAMGAAGGVPGMIIGGIIGFLTSIPDWLAAVDLIKEKVETAAEKLERLEDELKTEEQETLVAKGELDSLTTYREKLLAAKDAQYESAEARQEYIDLSNEIAAQFPSLIAGYDAEGNAVISLAESYQSLLGAKTAVYQKELTDQHEASMQIWKNREVAANKLSEVVGGQFQYQVAKNLYQSEGAKSWEVAVEGWAKQLGAVANEKTGSISEVLYQAFFTEYERRNYSGGMAKYGLSALGIDNYLQQIGKIFNDRKIYGSYTDNFEEFDLEAYTKDIVLNRHGQSDFFDNPDANLPLERVVKKLTMLFEQGYSEDTVSFTAEELFGDETFLEELPPAIRDEIKTWIEKEEVFTFDYNPSDILKPLSAQYKVMTKEIEKQQKNEINQYAEKMAVSSSELYGDYSVLETGIWMQIFEDEYEYYATNEEGIAIAEKAGKTAGEMLLQEATRISLDAVDFLTGLTGKTLSDAEKAFSSIPTTSKEEIDAYIETIKDEQLKNYLQEIFDAQLQEYNLAINLIKARYGKEVAEGEYEFQGAKIGEIELEELVKKIDTSYANHFNSQLSYYEELLTSDNRDRITKAMQAYVALVEQISNIVDPKSQSQAFAILRKGDFTTFTGLFSIIEELAQLDPTVFGENGAGGQSLADILENHVFNLETEWNSYLDHLSKSFQIVENEFNKALNGMTFDEAIDFSESHNLTIADFELVNGEFIFRGVNEYIAEEIQKQNESLKLLENKIQTQMEYGQISEDFTEEEMAYYDSLIELKKYFNERLFAVKNIEEQIKFNPTNVITDEQIAQAQEEFNTLLETTDYSEEIKDSLKEYYSLFLTLNEEGIAGFSEFIETKIMDTVVGLDTSIGSEELKRMASLVKESKELISEYQRQYFGNLFLEAGQIQEFFNFISGEEAYNLTEDQLILLKEAFRTSDISSLEGSDELTSIYLTFAEGFSDTLKNGAKDLVEQALSVLEDKRLSFDAEGNLIASEVEKSINLQNLIESGTLSLEQANLWGMDEDYNLTLKKSDPYFNEIFQSLITYSSATLEEYNSYWAQFLDAQLDNTRESFEKLFSDAEDGLSNEEIGSFATSIGRTIEDLEREGYYDSDAKKITNWEGLISQYGNWDIFFILDEYQKNASEEVMSLVSEIIESGGNASQSQTEALIKLRDRFNEDSEQWAYIDDLIGAELGFEDYYNLQSRLGEGNLEDIKKLTDDLISEERKSKEEASKELKEIISAKKGDALNLTYFGEIYQPILDNFGYLLQENGSYLVSENADLLGLLQHIQEYGAEGISESVTQIAETIQDVLKNWSNLISSGTKGELTHSERESLILNPYFNLDEDSFYQTSEGFGLTNEALASVYGSMQKLDPLVAQAMLPTLLESARATDEELNDIFSAQKKINRLQKKQNELAKKGTEESKKQNELLQMELDIAKAAKQEMLEAGNAFNFMERDAPTEITNPLSAWEGMAQAIQVLHGQDFKEGRMSYENLRAMLQFVDDNGIEVEGVGSGAEILEAAWGAMDVTLEHGAFVNLGLLGDYAFTAEQLLTSISSAVQKTADEQIALTKQKKALSEVGESILEIGGETGNFEITSAEGLDFFTLISDLTGKSFGEGNQELEQMVTAYPAKFQEVLRTYLVDAEEGIKAYERLWAELRLVDPNENIDEPTYEEKSLSFFENIGDSLSQITEALSSSIFTSPEAGLQFATTAMEQIQLFKEEIENLTKEPYTIDFILKALTGDSEEQNPQNQNFVNSGNLGFSTIFTGMAEGLEGANGALGTLTESVSSLNGEAAKFPADAANKVSSTASAMNSLRSKSITASITVSASTSEGGSAAVETISLTATDGTTAAKGNVALAKGTLVGELGPELVVSNGHYFVVGGNGAEFVDLPKDSIVFNHLQTKNLLQKGNIPSTGTPVVNERKSVALASGSSAKASLSGRSQKQKEVIGLWDRLAVISKNLSEKTNPGGGGSGEGTPTLATLHDLERWYNLLRQIEKLEQQINLRQQERENLTSGYDYVISLEKELDLLEKQKTTYSQLADLQKEYYDQRRNDLDSTDYSKIFTYDADGLMQYVSGEGLGLDLLATLNQTDAKGIPLLTAKQQVQQLEKSGFNINNFLTKADGSKIKKTDYSGIMEIFWSGIDSWMDELDGLYDEYNDHIISIEETSAAQLEIAQEYIDNQRSIEDKLLEAIVNREEAEIEKLQENLDAMQKATSQYIEGLNRSLQKEREMYEENKEEDETIKLQRQLAILQRTGGSASEIKSLQDQLDSRLQESYFSEQEKQIQAIQEASDLQLEKMQQQIDVMNETLEYQKENGLLWQEVSDMMMSWTPEAMMDFIERFTKTYREDSLLENEENSKETLKELEIWYAKQQENGRGALWENYLEDAGNRYDKDIVEENNLKAKEAFLSVLRDNGTESAAREAADKIFGNVKKEEEEKEKDEALQDPTNIKDDTDSKTPVVGWQFTWSGTTYKGYFTKKEAQAALDKMTSDYQQKYMLNNAWRYTSAIEASQVAYEEAMKKRGPVTAYKTGGLVDFTGPAWVDGTKAKPEAFLSAEDTALLKSKIFSNSNYSLKSAIESIQALGATISKSYNQHENEGVIIENAIVQIQTGAIASDYDARRAGELALDELMKIARRSSNIGVARR